MKFRPFTYQKEAIEFILRHKNSMTILGVGAGKTAIGLSVLYQLKFDFFEECKVVVISSKYAALHVWPQEIKKWDSFKEIRYAVVVGSAKEKMRAIHQNADCYITNYDAVEWLVKNDLWKFDVIIIDEISEFKNPKAKRYENISKLCAKADRVIGLSSEPLQNAWDDLWAEIYLLDQGKRLEKTLKAFIEKYFFRVQTVQGKGYYLEPKRGAERAIRQAIADICYAKASENWQEKDNIVNNVYYARLNSIEYTKYSWMQNEMNIRMKDSGSIDIRNQMELSTKLFQMANGAVYDNEQKVICIHERKMEALKEIIRRFPDQNIMIAYWFAHDRDRIAARYSGAKVIETMQDMEDWNQKKIKIGLIHPAVGGSDIHLYKGGNVLIWFSLTWSLHLYRRMIFRMTGEYHEKLYVEHIVTAKTIDEKIYKSLQKKGVDQAKLVDALLKEREENV